MNFDPFENLPDHIKEAIKDIMAQLGHLDSNEIADMIGNLLGSDFIKKLKDIVKGDNISSFPFDSNIIKNFESVFKDFIGSSSQKAENHNIEEENPYYEITSPVNGKGQIVVDVPGITDVRRIQWNLTNDSLFLSATSSDVIYKAIIPIGKKIKILHIFAYLKNSVFILPYKIIE